MRIFLIGPMGAGKSTLGKKLSSLLSLEFLDSDVLLAKIYNKSITQIFSLYGEFEFRLREEMLIQNISLQENVVIATGGGCILSPLVRQVLPERGIVCYLQVTTQQQMMRLAHDALRPLLPDASQRLEFFNNMREKRNNLYASIASIYVDTESDDIDTLTEQLAELTRHYASY